MRAIITRHYKTIINASDQILGWGDSPRDKGWKADVEFVSARLREHGVNFDAVYSSDLERSRQTAMFHARLFGIHIIHDTPALNEVNYGKLYKKKKKWVAEHYPQHKEDPDFVYPKGESFRQMQERSVNCLLSIAEKHPEQTVLIVVHAGVIRGLVSHFLDLNYADHLKHRISHRYIGDFLFDGETCVRYDELGKPSGFVRDGVIETPFSCSLAEGPVISAEFQPALKIVSRSAGNI
ncbi:MAG: histidine phosphatase family protein [Gammaproteobacteria bacterium]|jgi:broad specificity phosphatase PhoE|nr:histidine phosphatase family protein [Gammaproteobacteria bacterium]